MARNNTSPLFSPTPRRRRQSSAWSLFDSYVSETEKMRLVANDNQKRLDDTVEEWTEDDHDIEVLTPFEIMQQIK